eukprot:Skav232404  [mRNA]  locus=scaffold1077:741915:746805:+ [translate_table: standard]
MPGCGLSFPFWTSRLWTFLVLLFTFSFRVGEATVPGPVDGFDSSDHVAWDLPGVPDFILGTYNPSGLSNKFRLVDQLPLGWWHVAETQASKSQQCVFQGHLRSQSRHVGHCLHSTLGAPASLRPGSSHAGTWTGVLSYGPCLLKAVPLPWPSGVFESGRVLMTAANIFGLEIVAATVYLPPRGPTYPNAVELSEALLAPISSELVLGREGCRAILGDMNAQVGALQHMRLWQANGWVELQDLMQQLHGLSRRPTCKGATSPDQVWLSPELAALVINSALIDLFPDHHALLAGIKLPQVRLRELQWPLPGHVPWDDVDVGRWNDSPDLGPLFGANPSHAVGGGLSAVHDGESPPSNQGSTLAFTRWSKAFEHEVSRCLGSQAGHSDRSFHGRGRMLRPKMRAIQAPLIKPPRPGELAPASGFLNRSIAAWFKQMRRVQSYLHASRSERVNETYHARAALWNSIRHANGFRGGFCSWWLSRPYQLQGSPVAVPVLPPTADVAALIYEDFLVNYRRYEHWQLRRRTESCQAKLLAETRSLFLHTRKPAKPPLEYLVGSQSQAIDVVDTGLNLVRVPQPFVFSPSSTWLLQGQPAGVQERDDCYQVDSDLVLAPGQTLTCQTWVTKVEDIHARLLDLWTSRWNKHEHVPEEAWARAKEVASHTMPRCAIALPDISVQEFRRAVSAFKQHAATGPCGWSRADVAHLTDQQVEQVLSGYHTYERTGMWPQQWCVGLIHSLQKRDTAHDVQGFRPITVTSIYYRLFAGIRAGQILSQFARHADSLQCGFLKGHQASDVWYFVGVALELATHQAVPLFGIVADLVKAYNTLPRTPVFWCLELLGVPRWFLQAWQHHLAFFERIFVVRRCASSPVKSVTGFPEGCPLACVAMTALDFFWHWYVRLEVPRVLPLSYVDNLELVCDRLDDLLAASRAQHAFCSLLDLELNLPRLYAWSSTPGGRRDLKLRGFQVSLGERDLGGQVIYCKQLRNRVLTDRIANVQPYFQKLRVANIPQAVKILNIIQVLWPRAFHGVEAVTLGQSHLTKLRSGVMRALKWDRAGASPVVRLSLLHTNLDPSWQQLWRVTLEFRRHCARNRTLRDWWQDYHEGLTAKVTHGPFGKFQALFNEFGLHVDAQGNIWITAQACVNIFAATESLLRRVLLHLFHKAAAREAATRAHQELFSCWDELPRSFQLAGLVPQNPWTLLVWEALISLPDQLQNYAFSPSGHVWHVFTDGSCDSPADEEEALASWAVVVADKGPLSSGPLKGIQQNVLRAETTAVLNALLWIGPRTGEFHLWIDNQLVVDHLRQLLQQTEHPDEWEHSDLWHRVDRQLRVLFVTVHVHKVASHVDEAESLDPCEDFAIRWNSLADLQSRLAQGSRPSYFVNLWSRYSGFRRLWRRRVALLSSFHVAIAARDCHSDNVVQDEDVLEEQVSPLSHCIDAMPNTASFHAQFLQYQDDENLFAIVQDHLFVKVCGFLSRWIVSQDQLATVMRPVSFVEFYVVVRRFLGDHLTGLGGGSRFCHPTFSADFRIFRQMLTKFFQAIGVRGMHPSGHLSVVGVHVVQTSVTMGIGFDDSEYVLCSLRDFVGCRPIVNSQGFARPYRV